MQILVIGCGKVGSKFATVMAQEGHDIVIVEKDASLFRNLGPNFNGITIEGVPIDQDILKMAGIETADAFAALTPDDNVNIMASQVAREIFNVPKVIARIYNPSREYVFHHFGLETLCPTNMTVEKLKNMITGGYDRSKHIIAGIEFSFRQYIIEKEEDGKNIHDLNLDSSTHAFGIFRNGEFSFIDSKTILKEDDILLISEIDQ